jgi:imidazoleglycerol-phosphate dehydratase
MSRTAEISRKTNESEIKLSINLDGTGKNNINTSVPFFDHLFTALAKHSLIDIDLTAKGDTHIDVHHTVEDISIAFGQALQIAMGDKAGIERFGFASCPLDESLTNVTIDLSGRPFLVHLGEPEGFEYHLIGGHFTGSMMRHVFEAITLNAKICAHIELVRGRDPHHIAESEMKAFARALRDALAVNSRLGGQIPSTKGVLNV